MIILTTSCFGCDSENALDCIKITGEIIQQQVQLDYFNAIEALDEIDVYLINSLEQKVVIKTGKNLAPKINLEVKNQLLTITNDNKCNWTRSPQNPGVYIYSNEIISIAIFDYVNIYAEDTLAQRNLSIYSDGTGNFDMKVDLDSLLIESIYISNFHFSGESDYLYLNFINDSQFYGKNLKSVHCNVLHNGSNRIETFPIQSLEGQVQSTGSLYYFNDPEYLNVAVTGSGKLVDLSNSFN
jgi:hypothetical protein